ncbi:hypothetical protein LAZ67_12002829 [Cordylochernes scorpioides]|uniref:Uncharacterized protein n=1 Tax=Cordylochernes scorpioides TaxID=51811 RepID=A0ABY6L5K3_9ARAC|nr:hypothetical protein LAZ67_12002829 [Cordylochernes scorpioides]
MGASVSSVLIILINVLRGTTKPSFTKITTRSAVAPWNDPALRPSRSLARWLLARWESIVDVPRQGGLVLEAAPSRGITAMSASDWPSMPCFTLIIQHLPAIPPMAPWATHMGWRSIRPLVREAFNNVGRPLTSEHRSLELASRTTKRPSFLQRSPEYTSTLCRLVLVEASRTCHRLAEDSRALGKTLWLLYAENVLADSPFEAACGPDGPSSLRKNQYFSEIKETDIYENSPTDERYVNLAASGGIATMTPSIGDVKSQKIWTEILEVEDPENEDGYTVVQSKKRRRGSGAPGITAAQSNSAGIKNLNIKSKLEAIEQLNTDPEKIEAIVKFLTPWSITEVRIFIGPLCSTFFDLLNTSRLKICTSLRNSQKRQEILLGLR